MLLCPEPSLQEEQIEAAVVPTTSQSTMIFISRENHCRFYIEDPQAGEGVLYFSLKATLNSEK